MSAEVTGSVGENGEKDGGGREGRETWRKKKEGGRRVGSRVTGMQCRISSCPSEQRVRRRRERNERCAEGNGEAHLKVCTHTRVTRMLGLHPSHESKLFETEKEIRGGGRVNERETGKR